MTSEQVHDAVHAVPGFENAVIEIVRKDRHAPTSPLLRVIIRRYTPVEFMALTQIAGIFETPTLYVEARDLIQSPTPEIEGTDVCLCIVVQWR